MHRQRGLTLLELLVTLIIAGIVFSQALPVFSALVAHNQRTAVLNRFVAGLQYARSESLKRGDYVVLCKSVDGASCMSDGGWSAGWVVFVDKDRDRTHDADETLLRQFPALDSGMTAYANRNIFTLRPFGLRSTNGTFTVCSEDSAVDPRAVIVNVTVRPRVSEVAADGSTLKCP